MTSKFTELAIDCADPNDLARFWCSVLDYEVQDDEEPLQKDENPDPSKIKLSQLPDS
jgi:Glyoxalase-like domain